MDLVKRASCHEAGHMTVALHFDREVQSAGLFDGRPKTDCTLEPPGSEVPRQCLIFLAGGIAGERLCDPNAPFDSEGAGVDQQMITERGGGDIKEYLEEALAVLRSRRNAWAALQYAFLKGLRTAQVQSTMGGILGAGQGRTKTLLTSEQIKQIWNANHT